MDIQIRGWVRNPNRKWWQFWKPRFVWINREAAWSSIFDTLTTGCSKVHQAMEHAMGLTEVER